MEWFLSKHFNGKFPIEPYVYSSLLHIKIKEELSSAGYSDNDNVKLRYISKNASFHVSRIAAFLTLKTNSWKDKNLIKDEIEKIRDNYFDIQELTKKSFDTLVEVIDLEKDLNNTLKSSLLDSEISKHLNEKKLIG